MTDVAVAPAPHTLASRYGPGDLDLLDDDEKRRFLAPLGPDADAALRGDRGAWERIATAVAWELLYRKEPELYARLVAGETIDPRVIAEVPAAERVIEVAAGTGRLTRSIAGRCDHLIAFEPAAALRGILMREVGEHEHVEVRRGFFDDLDVTDAWADLVVSCSAFTAEETHGGSAGLEEMERVTAPGGRIVLVWPAEVGWLRERGFSYASFEGEMSVRFASAEEAVELARIFYPHAVDRIEALGSAEVGYEVLGINPPRDIAWKVID